MEEDEATGGGGEGADGSLGGGLGDWPDDDEEDNKPRHNRGAERAGASSSAAPTAPGRAPKRRADAGLYGSRPKKPKNTAATTRWQEAAVKAAQFQKAPKQRPMVSAAPLSCARAPSTSVIGAVDGSTGPRRVDPLADLQEATERNAREAWEEREKAKVAKAAQAEADAAAKARADVAATTAQAEEASHNQAPKPTCPQHADPPVPEVRAPTGEAGADQPVW
nr:uncharacterized protein LOC109734989 [Aegilops tauschii subsp. strangulata]